MATVDLSVIGKKTDPVIYEYTWKNVVLYALGVGATTDELPFIFELAHGGLKVLPSFCLVPAMRGYPPVGSDVDFFNFLHGEQTICLHRSLPLSGRIKVIGEITDIFDKGKAAVYHIKVSGWLEDGTHVFDTFWVNFYVGAGGFGGYPGPKSEVFSPPEGKAPDLSLSYKIADNQAALYRLNGDLNPLHIDPDFAKRGGFGRPILHGLCTYGHAVRAVVNGFLGGEVDRLKSFKARFSNPVYMGDLLTVEGWKDDRRLIVQVKTQDRVVMTNAVAEIS